MVCATDFGLGMSSISLACFVKVVFCGTHCLDHEIFEKLVSSVSRCRISHCLPWLLYLVKFVDEGKGHFSKLHIYKKPDSQAKSYGFVFPLTCSSYLMKTLSK